MVTRPGWLNLGIRLFGGNLMDSRPSWADEKQKTSDISSLTYMRHLAAPTTNMAVLEVSQPMAN